MHSENSEEKIVIPLGKTKIIFLLFGAVGFVVSGIWLFLNAESLQGYNPTYIRAVGVAAVIFFGACGIFGFFKWFDEKPGLILDVEGIVDNSSGVAAGHVPWEEITSITTSSIQGQKFITIVVKDPEKYVNRGNFIQQKLNAANLKFFGSPIQISSNSLQIKFSELEEVMDRFYEKFGFESEQTEIQSKES